MSETRAEQTERLRGLAKEARTRQKMFESGDLDCSCHSDAYGQAGGHLMDAAALEAGAAALEREETR
jgi:endonuclease/exonuclease/phosphatase family metal-dependent hydrolase